MKTHEAPIIPSAMQMNPKFVLAGILSFVASFEFSFGPIIWVLFSAIFPNSASSSECP